MGRKEIRVYNKRVYALDRVFRHKSDADRYADAKRAKGVKARVIKQLKAGWNYPIWQVFTDEV